MSIMNPRITVANGDDQWFHFDKFQTKYMAHNVSELEAILSAVDDTDKWRVVFLSYEAGLHFLGLDVQSTMGPLAAVWVFDTPSILNNFSVSSPQIALQPEITESQYADLHSELIEDIGAGELYQANLTFRFRGLTPEAASIARPIDTDTTPAWSAHVHDPAIALWSQSPECFLKVDGGSGLIETHPIKGTRGHDHTQVALQADAKEVAEHIMIVDMARNDLGQICQPGSVGVSPLQGSIQLTYAEHMVSRVYGRLKSEISWSEIFRSLLPAASISGTPKKAACRRLMRLEPSARGPYTGVLGWIDPEGNGAFSILIRTLWTTDHKHFVYGTGGGIVADSIPVREYEEAILKTMPVRGKNLRA